MFNGVAHPSLCMLHTNGDAEILRRFEYKDYKNRMS
jgi:carboxynorspermidine decarboxylase